MRRNGCDFFLAENWMTLAIEKKVLISSRVPCVFSEVGPMIGSNVRLAGQTSD
jgi:hypothetical protein